MNASFDLRLSFPGTEIDHNKATPPLAASGQRSAPTRNAQPSPVQTNRSISFGVELLYRCMFVSRISAAYHFYIGVALVRHETSVVDRYPYHPPVRLRTPTTRIGARAPPPSHFARRQTLRFPETRHGSIGYNVQSRTMEEHRAIARSIRFSTAAKSSIDRSDDINGNLSIGRYAFAPRDSQHPRAGLPMHRDRILARPNAMQLQFPALAPFRRNQTGNLLSQRHRNQRRGQHIQASLEATTNQRVRNDACDRSRKPSHP